MVQRVLIHYPSLSTCLFSHPLSGINLIGLPITSVNGVILLSAGPKGKLQTYLEGLAAVDDVKTYVEQLPFGQGAIDEKSQNWAFYSRVLKGQNR